MTETDIDAKKIADEFLNTWQEAHETGDQHLDYSRLGKKFALFTGTVSIGEANAVARELYKGRQARGWPDPDPGRLDPGIEGGIYVLWLGGLRRLERDAECRDRPSVVTDEILRIFETFPSRRWQQLIQECLRDAFAAVAEDALAGVNAEDDE